MAWFRRRRGGGPDALVDAARRFVDDDRVLDAMRTVDRADFVPEGSGSLAYADRPVPLPQGQTTSQPSLIAGMVAALELRGDERVLEVGTGYGYQTALLAELAEEVVSIERYEELAAAARGNLDATGYRGVTVVVGDGHEGVPEHAPYGAIILSAATPDIPRPLIDQLAEGGHLVAPVGRGGSEQVLVYRRRDGELREERRVTRARFVPMMRGQP
jgi:protein-L-isoaspartate(D-aspartate) O-methyltransferase